jgi:hypothetical protein
MSTIRRVIAIWGVLVALLCSSCTDENCKVDAADYDQSCVVADDCVIVTDGNLCSSCQCPRAVINKHSFEQFRDDTRGIEQEDGPVCDCAAFLAVECVDRRCQGLTQID